VKASDIVARRMRLQRIAGPPAHKFATPADAVRWFGAVQAQDYPAARWAIGLRLRAAVEADVDAAFDRGEILRTHVLRPTWHLVTPEALRWMVTLTAPRIRAQGSHRDRELGLDERLFARSQAAIARALEGGKHATRIELGTVLTRAKLAGEPQQRTHILMRAELDGLICSGPLRGKQHTYALIDERVPAPRTSFTRDASLAELARVFFTSRGPATLKDFAWWSGLTLAQARESAELVTPRLGSDRLDDKTYFFADGEPVRTERGPTVHLLPNYDEYLVPYVDRDGTLDAQQRKKLDPRGGSIFQNVVLVGGRIAGTWRRTLTKGRVRVAPLLLAPMSATEKAGLAAAIERYARFLGRSVG
jgi:hypothetical protein